MQGIDGMQAAQRQGTVSQEIARQTDGVLLAVGSLSSVLKKKVGCGLLLVTQVSCCMLGHCMLAGRRACAVLQCCVHDVHWPACKSEAALHPMAWACQEKQLVRPIPVSLYFVVSRRVVTLDCMNQQSQGLAG